MYNLWNTAGGGGADTFRREKKKNRQQPHDYSSVDSANIMLKSRVVIRTICGC